MKDLQEKSYLFLVKSVAFTEITDRIESLLQVYIKLEILGLFHSMRLISRHFFQSGVQAVEMVNGQILFVFQCLSCGRSLLLFQVRISRLVK